MTMLQGYTHMVDFFTSFDWWKTEPHDELVNHGNYCLAKLGEIYAVYLPDVSSPYTTVTSTPAQLTISPVTLSVTGITAGNKVYDGTTAATLNTSSASLVGVLPSDQGHVSLNPTGYTAKFTGSNAGESQPSRGSGGCTS